MRSKLMTVLWVLGHFSRCPCGVGTCVYWVTELLSQVKYLLLPGAYDSIRESYERSTAAQRRVDSTTDIVRSSQQVRRAVDELLQRRQDEFDNGYNFNNVSLTNISIRIDRFRVRIRDLNDVVRRLLHQLSWFTSFVFFVAAPQNPFLASKAVALAFASARLSCFHKMSIENHYFTIMLTCVEGLWRSGGSMWQCLWWCGVRKVRRWRQLWRGSSYQVDPGDRSFQPIRVHSRRQETWNRDHL